MTAERPIFVLRLQPGPGVDGVRALRVALKFLLRRWGLRVISIDEEKNAQSPAPTIGD
jgi:hypothetical protein